MSTRSGLAYRRLSSFTYYDELSFRLDLFQHGHKPLPALYSLDEQADDFCFGIVGHIFDEIGNVEIRFVTNRNAVAQSNSFFLRQIEQHSGDPAALHEKSDIARDQFRTVESARRSYD